MGVSTVSSSTVPTNIFYLFYFNIVPLSYLPFLKCSHCLNDAALLRRDENGEKRRPGYLCPPLCTCVAVILFIHGCACCVRAKAPQPVTLILNHGGMR
ncbi:hypothetical protein PRIPAC_90088 [Pristionchus pacificus]|uniref:Uncharacterized protein n=1 Tax=Pristionchus pacificus TaxID=54126 RepID=A0A2A6CXN6_PRIPA|nr:hypothetical protein PRIPAC_90088 [Pristionchus pacificus]|eukprot:PDM82982.1 hypothetical protein PRIPAC_37375 [Pristionchus pacificus]